MIKPDPAERWNLAKIRLGLGLRTTRGLGAPATIILEVTNRCNIECIMCLQTQDPRYHNDPGFVADADFSLVKKLEPVLPSHPVVCTFGIGEPLLNKRIFDIFDLIKKHGARIAITTNATPLNSQIIDRLLNGNLDSIVFSMDGTTQEVFESIRHKASFTRVWNNVEAFCERKRSLNLKSPKVSVEFVAMARNFHQLPSLVEFAGRLQMQSVIVQPLIVNDWEVAKNRLAGDWLYNIELEKARSIWSETRQRAAAAGVELVSPFLQEPLENYFGDSAKAKAQVAAKDTAQPGGAEGNAETGALRGYIDYPIGADISGQARFAGWAVDFANLNRPVTILFERNGDLLHEQRCDVVRPDVWTTFSLSGEPFPCGFEFSIDIEPSGKPIELYMKTDERKRLLGSFFVRGKVSRATANLRDWLSAWLRPSPSAVFCTQPWSVIQVGRNGLVRTCCSNETVLGDLTVSSISEVWNGPAYRDFRNKVRKGVIDDQCARCLSLGLHRNAGVLPGSLSVRSLVRRVKRLWAPR